ncbi:putative WRKY transcription factor 64 [Cardamine amara subsp. amara]|uniref:WRKY transcription factor 64 n=1 Tax=Cardamine amara subsp. amara TaxID=228776 RepID=A0ABD1C120_CARAN
MSSYIDQKAVTALLRGQGCANSLKTLLENREISPVTIEPLINTIHDSFSLALSSIKSPNPPSQHESSQNMAGHVPRRSSKKTNYGAEGLEIYTVDSPTPRADDGFNWRKYGQKKIKGSLHHRCYYRCNAKHQNCRAKKQVQKIEDSPPIYRATYLGKHDCKAPAFVVKDDTDGSKMIKLDQVVSEPVMPQLGMEDQTTDHIMNQDFDINDFVVDVDEDQFWASQYHPFSSEDFMFFESFPALD